jgi:hypothetical protein
MSDDPPKNGKQQNERPNRNERSRLFLAGGLFVRDFTLPIGQLKFAATVLIRGTDLELWDAEIFPASGGRMTLGVTGIRRLIDDHCRLAKADGLDIVRLSGYRLGGSSPGRESDIRVVCRNG